MNASTAPVTAGTVMDRGLEIAVVVSTRDRDARLQALLESLLGQTLDRDHFEVVVVDDGSSDGTGELLARWLENGDLPLRVITERAGTHQGVGRNRGWRATAAPMIAFIDDDCVAMPQWLEMGLRCLTGDSLGFVQGRTVPHPGEVHRHGPFSRTMHVHRLGPYFQTCNIFYPRSLLERLGGIDERLTTGEDADLAWRAIDAGARPSFVPGACVLHAIENLGLRRHLRGARRWADVVEGFRRHQGLRESVLVRGVFWKRQHALITAALLGALLAPRYRPALLLALPYLRYVRHRCRESKASLAFAPYFALFDAIETATTIRGAVRHRVLVI